MGEKLETTFQRSSFNADPTSAMLAGANRVDETYLTAKIDLDASRAYRQSRRDRRHETYGLIEGDAA